MSFRTAIETCLRQYAGFTGRATRAEYWWFFLFTVVVVVAADLIGSLVNSATPGGLAIVVLLLPGLAVAVRRVHDSDRSGWWVALGVVAWLVAAVAMAQGVAMSAQSGIEPVQRTVDPVGAAFAFGGVALAVVALVTTVVLLTRPSTPGTNRFGPHPGSPAAAVERWLPYS